MKLFTSAKRIFLHSIALLFTVCSLFLTVPTALAASADAAPVQYIAAATTAPAPTQTVEEIDELIAYFREQKYYIGQKITNKDEETTETDKKNNAKYKTILNEINSEINALIKDKKALQGK